MSALVLGARSLSALFSAAAIYDGLSSSFFFFFFFFSTSWSFLVSPPCRCFSGSLTSLLFRWVFLVLLPFVLVVSIPSTWFSDSIGITVSLAMNSPFGSSRFRLALAQPRCLGLGVCLFPSSWVSEQLSVAPQLVSLVSSSFLSFCMEELRLWW